jgi:serine/threonine-protein kinase RsbW
MPKMKAPAKLENMAKLQQFVADFAGNHGFSSKRITEIELACEEALVNIIHHAYPEDMQGEIEIDCKADHQGNCIIQLIDTGQPFDLKALSDPDINEDISRRKVGGLGCVLMKQFADEISYRRHQNKNFLTLQFYKPN